jgi:hypothetical protein
VRGIDTRAFLFHEGVVLLPIVLVLCSDFEFLRVCIAREVSRASCCALGVSIKLISLEVVVEFRLPESKGSVTFKDGSFIIFSHIGDEAVQGDQDN